MQVQPFNDWFALGKSYVNPAKNYTSYTIDYFDTESVLTNATVVSPKKVTHLFPAEVPSSFTVNVNNVITRDCCWFYQFLQLHQMMLERVLLQLLKLLQLKQF